MFVYNFDYQNKTNYTVMKTKQILLTLLLMVALTFASNAQENQILIGCFSGSTPSMGYSSAKLDIIMKLYLNDGNTYTNSSIKYDTDENGNGFFYIRSETTGATVGVTLETQGNFLYLKKGCKHSCSSTGTCACDLKIVTQCESIQCVCATGEGGCSSSIETGFAVDAVLLEYATNNPANCN